MAVATEAVRLEEGWAGAVRVGMMEVAVMLVGAMVGRNPLVVGSSS